MSIGLGCEDRGIALHEMGESDGTTNDDNGVLTILKSPIQPSLANILQFMSVYIKDGIFYIILFCVMK